MKTAIITGYALNDSNQLELMEDTRVKADDASPSHSASKRWIGTCFPNTQNGMRDAAAECLKRNLLVRFK